jgi:hypothetical protein
MKSIEEFKRYYDTELRAVLEPLEIERKASLKKTFIAAAVLIPLSVVIAALVLNMSGSLEWSVITLIIGMVLAGGAAALFTKDFKSNFKNRVIRPVIQYVSSDLSYAPNGTISRSEFESSTLFTQGVDRFKGEDFIEGIIDKTQIRFSELHAEYKTTSTDSKGNTRTSWHTIFKGLFFVADFNKHFQGRTVVLPDSAEKLFGRLGQKFQSMNMSRDDLVKLEDPEFEKEFVVYATDQVEARYILSPALMRRILEFKRRLKVPVHIGFVNSNLYMALSIKKNMFEPRIMRSILDFEMVREYLEDLILAVGIVEDMNLNTRIWTKD